MSQGTKRNWVWTDGGTWIGAFTVGSALFAWAVLSLPVDGAARGALLVIGIVAIAAACLFGRTHAIEHARLPSLDMTPRTAQVREVRGIQDADHPYEHAARRIIVDYAGADGRTHRAWLGDLIHETSIDPFTPGSTWQVHTFDDPALADATVLLAAAHDDVVRGGFMLDGVAGIRGFSSFHAPAPGSPFLHGKRDFAG